MNMITWAKRSLAKFNGLWLVSLFFASSAFAALNTSALFIPLSDALNAEKTASPEAAKPYVEQIAQHFNQLTQHHSPAGEKVNEALKAALQQPDRAQLEALSVALYQFEKEQNPPNIEQKRMQFFKRILPVYQQLADAIASQQIEAIKQAYKQFNSSWTMNERIVRETSLGHYGQIETAMTVMRIAMLAEKPNFAEMQTQSTALHEALMEFKSGKTRQIAAQNDAPQTLKSGIALLKTALNALQNNQTAPAQRDLMLFVQQWPVFEGEVSTRDGALYSQVESELPVIISRGNEAENIQALAQLIDKLEAINSDAGYGIVDAMLILLREGVEALLIILALITSLNVAKQPQAKRWVYAGAGLGVVASLLGALLLQRLFPTLTAGTSREILEGAVGIVAVLMMLVVGAWLHSKSSIQSWQRFINARIQQAVTTGSLISMLSLSFLSVFREGAETVLFYVGILPKITLSDLLLGIASALVVLAVIAVVMVKSTKRLPIHHLFKVMTLLIYALGFKILGVSIHALQLTNQLPQHLLSLPTLSEIGFFPSAEGIGAQLVYLLAIPLVAKLFKG